MLVEPSDVEGVDPRLLRYLVRWCAEAAALEGPDVAPIAPIWSRFGLALGGLVLQRDPGPSAHPSEDQAFRRAMASMATRLLEDPPCP